MLAGTFSGDDHIELFFWDHAIAIVVSPVDHFLKFMFLDIFTQFSDNSPQIFDGDEASFLIIEEVEHFPNIFPGVFIRNPGGHKMEEVLEANTSWSISIKVSDHLIDGLVLCLEAKWIQSCLQV